MKTSLRRNALFTILLITLNSCYTLLGLHEEERYTCYLIHSIELTYNLENMQWEETDTVDYFTEGFIFQTMRPTNKCEEAIAEYGDLSSEYWCSCCWEKY